MHRLWVFVVLVLSCEGVAFGCDGAGCTNSSSTTPKALWTCSDMVRIITTVSSSLTDPLAQSCGGKSIIFASLHEMDPFISMACYICTYSGGAESWEDKVPLQEQKTLVCKHVKRNIISGGQLFPFLLYVRV